MSDEIGIGIEVGTTKMTSQGQVVIPDGIRKILGVGPGTKFVVYGDINGVVFKPVKEPTAEEFKQMLDRMHKQAREAGITQDDINRVIREYREKYERSGGQVKQEN